MEQYDVYASRSSLLDQPVSLSRSHGKIKRDQTDFTNDAFKPNSIKIPRHSQLPSLDTNSTESTSLSTNSSASTADLTTGISINTMSVLPRLLRTMANGNNGQSLTSHSNTYKTVSSVSGGTLTIPTAASGTRHCSTTPFMTDAMETESSSFSPSPSGGACVATAPMLSTASTTSTTSNSLISFLSPVAAMAAAALSSSTGEHHSVPHQTYLGTSGTDDRAMSSSTVSCGDDQLCSNSSSTGNNNSQEPSGLVTLATASSLIEKEWLTRAVAVAVSTAAAMTTTATPPAVSFGVGRTSPSAVLLGTDEQHQQHPDSYCTEADRKLLTTTVSPLINGTTSGTHAVLDVQSLAALLCETQKHCSSRNATASATTSLTDSCTDVRMVVASDHRDHHHLATTLDDEAAASGAIPVQQSMLVESSGAEGMPQSPGGGPATTSGAATAFISLQPAPGSLLASSNFHQLMASGEFMSPAARQTLLGQSSDGTSRQLYLLVPTDCPVIMSRPSNTGGQQTDEPMSSVSPPPPILESLTSTTGTTSTAPILEAISPDVADQPDSDVCTGQFSLGNGLQPGSGGFSQLTTVSGSPTALSTLIAGLEASSRNQQQQQQQNHHHQQQQLHHHHQQQLQQHHHHHHQQLSPTVAAVAAAVAAAASVSSSTASPPPPPPVSWSASTDPLRLPGVGVVSVSGGGVGLISNAVGQQQQQQRCSRDETAAVRIGDVNALLGNVKSDPDMYTPNGHLYTGIDETGRFRCYSSIYPQSSASCITNGTTATNSNGLLLRSSTTVSSSSAAAAVPSTAANFFHLASSSSSMASHELHHLSNSSSLLLSQTVMPASSSALINAAAAAAAAGSGGGGIHLQHLSAGGVIAAPSAAAVLTSPSSSAACSTVTSAVAASLSAKTLPFQPLVIEDCQRPQAASGALLTPTSVNRIDPAYLEHINSDSKDIRRRVSHNEVERRRRDRINTWISELYKLLPPDEQAKSQYQSKGMVLKRVFEYFQNVDSMLNAANTAVEQTRIENGLLRQRLRDLQNENQLLSASLQLGAAAAAAQLKQRQPVPSSLKGKQHCGDGEADTVSIGSMVNGELPSISVVSHLRHPANSAAATRGGDQLIADYQTTVPDSCNGGGGGGLTLFTVGTSGVLEQYNPVTSCGSAAAAGAAAIAVPGVCGVGGQSGQLPSSICVSINPTSTTTTAGSGGLLINSTSIPPAAVLTSSRPVITLPSLELVAGSGATSIAAGSGPRSHADSHAE